MQKWWLTVLIFFIAFNFLSAQVVYYEDNFSGGVTGGGYSPSDNAGGSGNFTIHIEPGSTIRKALFMAGRHGYASPLTVTLNGTPYTFDMSNQASPTFFSFAYGGASGTHVIDVTASINPSVTNYTVNVPNQSGPMDRYNDFYLYVAYDNASLLNVSTAVFLNDQNFFPYVSYSVNVNTPFVNSVPIGVMLFNGYQCASFDADSVLLNGTHLGNTYGPDGSSGWCGGPVANFYYQSNTLFGLGDDNPDQAMAGPDVTSNAQALIANNSTSFSMLFFHGNNDNAHWALILAYGTCPSINITTTNDTTLCPGDSVQLNASGGNSYLWFPAAGLSNSNISNPIATPTSSTTYYVVASNGICSDTDSVAIAIVNNLTADAGADVSVCAGDSIQLNASGGNSFLWSPATGLSNVNIANPVAAPPSTTTYSVIVSSGTCSDTDSVVVTVLPLPIADGGADVSICAGESIQLNASGGSSYLWLPATGLSSTNISNPVATPTSTITYYVVASFGTCSDSDSVMVTVMPPPTADAGIDVTICAGESAQLNASGGISYLWSPAVGLNDATISNPLANPSVTTNYIVTVSIGQCYDSDSVAVIILPPPTVDLGPNITIDKSAPVTLTAISSATSFSWSPPGNLSCDTCQTVIAFPDTTTTYYVLVTDNYGCTNLDSITIFIGSNFSIYIPNVFTPNGDLVNNVFYVYGENIRDLTLYIFNRWGELIFESKDITEGWDGKYKGIPAPMGTYVYMATFTGAEGGTEMRTGKVSLIR